MTPEFELPKELADIHLAYRGKRITGPLAKQIQLLKVQNGFKDLCRRAKRVYGLSPREISIHYCLNFVLNTGSKGTLNNPGRFSGLNNLVDGGLAWRLTIQGETMEVLRRGKSTPFFSFWVKLC